MHDTDDLTNTQAELAALFEDEADRFAARSQNGGECPSCGRVMSVREGAEQGVCNDCLGGAL